MKYIPYLRPHVFIIAVPSASHTCPLLLKQNGCLLPMKPQMLWVLEALSASSSWGGSSAA